MKRYWRSIVLAGFIIATFSTYYIHSALAMGGLPNFVISHKSGSEKEIEGVKIWGYYQGGETEGSIMIDKNGSEHVKFHSYLDMITDNHFPKVIQQLQKDYRGFMRDKQEGGGKFFEDDEIVAYADVLMDFHYTVGNYSFTFDIDILDKKTKKQTKFSSKVPQEQDYQFMYPEAVQVTEDNIIKIVTRNMVRQDHEPHVNSNSSEENHIYTFDLEKQSLIDDEVVEANDFVADIDPEDDRYNIHTYSVLTLNSIGPEEYIVFDISIEEIEDYNIEEIEDMQHHMQPQFYESYLSVYHFPTGEQRVIDLPEEISEDFRPAYFHDSVIYFENYGEDRYEVVLYDFIQEEIIGQQTFAMEPMGDYWPDFRFNKDKFYMLSPISTESAEATLQVIDLKTGETLYEGVIEKENGAIEDDYRLELHFQELPE